MWAKFTPQMKALPSSVSQTVASNTVTSLIARRHNAHHNYKSQIPVQRESIGVYRREPFLRRHTGN
jgi:hypothetical protein